MVNLKNLTAIGLINFFVSSIILLKITVASQLSSDEGIKT